MKPFPYAGDRLCRIACGFYIANRWCMPALWKGAFLRGHFNDLLFIPAALPPLLWLQRRLGLRTTDVPPGWSEVGWHLLIWSIAAELVGPLLFPWTTADGWDLVAYAVGATVAAFFWGQADSEGKST